MSEIYEILLERIQALPVIDTHEHLTFEKDFLTRKYDFTHLMSYVGLDLGLAGFPCGYWETGQAAVQKGENVAEKWRRIRPYWDFVRTGIYGRAYRRSLKIFFGVDDLSDTSVFEISEKIKDYQYPGVYQKYLQEKYNIQAMLHVQDHQPAAEAHLFAKIYYLGDSLDFFSRAQFEAETGTRELPPNYEAFREFLRDRIRTAARNGAVGLKIGMMARYRPLDFCPHPAAEIEAAYQYLLNHANGNWLDPANMARLKPFHDAGYQAAFEIAGELGLPVQIHSGLEFPQPWDGRPSALIPSIIQFPETRFVIFHGSYPHLAELTGLAKSFRNVYLDLAWLHLLSEHQTLIWLHEWLDVLPHNKLFAFGGDVFLFFGVCSHLEIARENIARLLARRVQADLFNLEEAEHCAWRLFYENPRQAFAFENWQKTDHLPKIKQYRP